MGIRLGLLALVSTALVTGCNNDGDSNSTSFGPPATMTATEGMTDTEPTTPDSNDGSTGEDTDGSTTDDPQTTTSPNDTDEETTGTPSGEHALARITIGETHPSGQAAATAVVSAAFFPDAATLVEGCSMDVAGCTVTTPPACAVTCPAPQTCVYDEACTAVCQQPCDLACPAGQECYYPIVGATACKPIETFDGGRLDFFGTTEPVSLFPPYVFPAVSGTITQPNAELSVTGSGSVGPGFAMFEGSVTAADSLITNLSMIPGATAFGVGDVDVTWAPGEDEVSATAVVAGTLGGTGSVTCSGDDTAGTLSIPRAALDAALPIDDTPASMAVTVQRVRTEVTPGAMTQGALLEETVQPEGWVEFSFISAETFTLLPG